jgi:hypothetical protein
MINAFMSKNELHAVHEIRRDGMTKIRAKGFCATEDDDKLSIYQVPDWAFDGRTKYGEITVCAKCAQAAVTMKTPPPR